MWSPDHTVSCLATYMMPNVRTWGDPSLRIALASSEQRVAPLKSKPSSPELKLNYRDYLKGSVKMAGAGVEGELTQEVSLKVQSGSVSIYDNLKWEELIRNCNNLKWEELIRGTNLGAGTAKRAVFQQWKESSCAQCLLEVFSHQKWLTMQIFNWNVSRSDPLEACLQRSCLENTVHIYNHKVGLLHFVSVVNFMHCV